METERWTMVELVARVAAALDGATYAGAPNGRVRDVPDARVIRWYATIGLVDKPAEMRGRTALYGRRHLLQLVAVKRRQAEGRSIAEIQAELAGAPDETLRRIAALPSGLLGDGATLDATNGHPSPARPRFWAGGRQVTVEMADEPLREPSALAPYAADAPASVAPASSAPVGSAPASSAPVGTAPASVTPAGSVPAASSDGPVVSGFSPVPGGLLTGVPLGGGAVLLLPGTPVAADLAAIVAAAAPLIDVLVARDLVVEFDQELLGRHSDLPDGGASGTTPSIDQSTDSRTDVTR